MEPAEAFDLLQRSRVARMATVRPDAGPHIVPVTYAVIDETIVTMIDHKPKTTTRLQRLANIEHDPRVSLLVDEWSEDWEKLSWARFDCHGDLHEEDDVWASARDALALRYEQYRDRAPSGTAIVLTIEKITYWSSTR